MADVLTPEQRRKNMQHIKSNNTKIEVLLRKALWKKGYRYRKNYKKLPGKPDIALTKLYFVMESFFMVKIGKCLNLVWNRVITVNFGLKKSPEIERGTIKLTKNCCLWDGQ